jgi:hypothetical protein
MPVLRLAPAAPQLGFTGRHTLSQNRNQFLVGLTRTNLRAENPDLFLFFFLCSLEVIDGRRRCWSANVLNRH